MAIQHRSRWYLGAAVLLVAALGAVLTVRFRRDRPKLSESLTDSTPAGESEPVPLITHPDDWAEFRGPAGKASRPDADVPLEWSNKKNLRWTTRMPGPGSSSPIVVRDRIFVTCYSGYGVDAADPGNPEDLARHVVCLDRHSGEIKWQCDVEAVLPEDPYSGYLTEHGYASHTPVSDGQAVYAFLGKSGVTAWDLDGKSLWTRSVGTQSDSRQWGSASSLVLYGDILIVNAASESRTIRGLDKRDGKEVWSAYANSMDLSFGTPVLVRLPAGRAELALCIPGELWGLNPATGTLNWFASVPMRGNVSPSVAVHDGTIYATGGYRGRGTVAVAAGGKGNVTDTHVQWTARESTYVPSPIWHHGHLYWVDDRGIAVCLDASSGQVVYQERVRLRSLGGRSVYASPVLAGDKLIIVTRRAGTVILDATPSFHMVATNPLDDGSDFNATPAIVGDELFLRSNRAVYCIARDAVEQ